MRSELVTVSKNIERDGSELVVTKLVGPFTPPQVLLLPKLEAPFVHLQIIVYGPYIRNNIGEFLKALFLLSN